jgi:sec-independent protein translocase protein TatA
MPGFVGPWELALVAVLALLLFGAKRLPEVARSLGRSLREIRQAAVVKDALDLRQEARETLAEIRPGRKADRE